KKLKAVLQRTVWGVVMAAGAIGLVCMGHVYVIALVFIIQAVVFKELTALFDAGTPEREAKRKGRKEERERWSRKMAWYFFAVTNYYLYGESLIYYFKHILTLQASFLPTAYTFAQHHRLISFGLYTIGFVSFVATLNRASLRRQFSLFGWIHMSLLLIVVSSHFIVNNILEGMIWFWVPISLVIVNDVAAYVCGMLFGRHQLIKLSPKKTVEGFVGALIVTMIFAYFWGTFFMRFNYMICPVQDLSTSVFSNIKCQPNHVFEWHRLPIPASLTALLEQITRKHITAIPYAPFQLHSIVLAAFASLVAPFGGFFASGFKRAAGIKDFGNSLPGHGGFLDRMDCQFLMGLFTFVYHSSLVREIHASPSQILSAFATLTTEQQVQVLEMLKHVVDHKSVRA
ncbi:phosphatidate cytidylyltransferase, partial [Rhodotorula sp. JG-1b]